MSISSMTGFGRGVAASGGLRATVEIRAVNHRSLHWKGRFPPQFQSFEIVAQAAIRSRVLRGSVTLTLEVQREEGALGCKIDPERARAYLDQLDDLRAKLGIEEQPRLETLLSLPGVVEPVEAESDSDAVRGVFDEALEAALDRLVEARSREGSALLEAVETHLAAAEARVSSLEAMLPEVTEAYRERLERRMRTWLEEKGHAVDDVDLLREVALFSERTDVAEETARLRAHVQEARRLLVRGGAVGRELDFLTQEMLREANTLGAKSSAARAAQLVVETRAELERLREQVQNIE